VKLDYAEGNPQKVVEQIFANNNKKGEIEDKE